MRKLVLIAGVILSLHTSAEVLEKSKIINYISGKVAELEIDSDIELGLDVFDGVEALVGYNYQVEPSFLGRYYTRVDKYYVGSKIKTGSIINELSPFYLNINAGAEVVFARLHKSQLKAATALPIAFTKIPFTAKSALKLREGTFVSIPSKLNIVHGVKGSSALSLLNGGVNAYHLLRGDFNVQVLRLRDNKVRLRFFTSRTKGSGVNSSASVSTDFFELKIVNKVIQKVVKKDLLSIGASTSKGYIVLFDYIIDLNNEDAKLAYNAAMKTTMKFKAFKVLNPFLKNKPIEDQIITDLSSLEKISHEDKDEESKRVERLIKGVDQFKGKGFKLGLKLTFFNWGMQNDKIKHHFHYYKENEAREDLFMYNRSKEKGHSFFWGFGKEKVQNNYYLLSKANEQGLPLGKGITDIGISYESKDKKLKKKEQLDLKEYITKQVSLHISKLIDWNQVISEEKQINARSFLSVTYSKKAISAMGKLSLEQIDQAIKEHVINLNSNFGTMVFDESKKNLKSFRQKMLDVLDLDLRESSEEKIEDMEEFSGNKVFQKIGMGAVIHVLSKVKEPLKDLVRVELLWSAKNLKKYRFEFGFADNLEDHDSLAFLREIILRGKSIDFRLLGYDPNPI